MKIYDHGRLRKEKGSWYLEIPWRVGYLSGFANRPHLHFWFRATSAAGLAKHTADRFSMYVSSFAPDVLNNLVYLEAPLHSGPTTLAKALRSLADYKVNIWETRSIDLGNPRDAGEVGEPGEESRVELLCEITPDMRAVLQGINLAQKSERCSGQGIQSDLHYIKQIDMLWKPSVSELARSIVSYTDPEGYATSDRSTCFEEVPSQDVPNDHRRYRIRIPDQLASFFKPSDRDNYVSLVFDSDVNALKAVSRNPAEVLFDLKVEVVNQAGELRRVLEPLGEQGIDFRNLKHCEDFVRDGLEMSGYLVSANIRDAKARLFTKETLKFVLLSEIRWKNFMEQDRSPNPGTETQGYNDRATLEGYARVRDVEIVDYDEGALPVVSINQPSATIFVSSPDFSPRFG